MNKHEAKNLENLPTHQDEGDQSLGIGISPSSDVEDIRNETNHQKKGLVRSLQDRAIKMLDSDEWPDELKGYVYNVLISYVETEEDLIDLQVKVDFLHKNIPIDLLLDTSIQLINLFFLDTDYLKIMKQYLGENEWLKTIRNPQKCGDFGAAFKGAAFTSPGYAYFSKRNYANLAKRPMVTTTAEEGIEEKLTELNDVLVATGIDKIATPIVDKITLKTPSRPNNTSGKWSRITRGVEVKIGPEKKSWIIHVILHELGHAFKDMLRVE